VLYLIEKFHADITQTNDIRSGINDADVVYACRIQKERFADQYEAEKLQKSFKITPEILENAKEKIDYLLKEYQSYVKYSYLGIIVGMILMFSGFYIMVF
jgi:hypothetical protein